jgi:hypothetical protein
MLNKVLGGREKVQKKGKEKKKRGRRKNEKKTGVCEKRIYTNI